MASSATLAQSTGALAAVFPTHECAYCQASIATGQRWVREKIFESLTGDAAHYRRYHADLYGDEVLSCWEKHQVQAENAKRGTRNQ